MKANLRGLKLRVLVGRHLAGFDRDLDLPGEPTDIGVGAALVSGDEAWILIEDRANRALGIGLSWMQRAGASRLHLLVDDSGGALARRAEHFAADVAVWQVRDGELVRAQPIGHRLEDSPRPDHLDFASVISDAGADVVIEHGIVGGEVVGLEVCRVVDDPVTAVPRLEIGVGVHDREAFALMHSETPPADSLKRIVEVVRGHRRPGADPHPLNRLAAERALRHRVLHEPPSIGAVDLRPVSSVEARTNVKDPFPCAALGTDDDGRSLVAVFSTGIDLDVVPMAADIRSWHGVDEAELVVVVPERDASPVTRRLASLLHRPASVVGIDFADTRSRSLNP